MQKITFVSVNQTLFENLKTYHSVSGGSLSPTPGISVSPHVELHEKCAGNFELFFFLIYILLIAETNFVNQVYTKIIQQVLICVYVI